MPADGPARLALARNGGSIVTGSLDEAIVLAQRLAPEHLVCDSLAVARRLTRAGTVFVGDFSAQAAGRLRDRFEPRSANGGTPRRRGGLSAADFVRVSTLQRVSAQGSDESPRQAYAGGGRGALGACAIAARPARRNARRTRRQRRSMRDRRTDGLRIRARRRSRRRAAVASQREHRRLLPAVLAALHGITREQAACYPDYDEVTRACADRFGVVAGSDSPDERTRRGHSWHLDRRAATRPTRDSRSRS